jgi:hypothetical protein
LSATLLRVLSTFLDWFGQTLKIRIDHKWGLYLVFGIFEFDECVLFLTGRGPADGRVIRTPPPTIPAEQTRRINCDHSWKSEISEKNLVPIYIVYF